MQPSIDDTSLNRPRRRPFLLDTTLRDGEQAPGVLFSLSDKLALMRTMLDMGIRQFEVGTPAMGADQLEALKGLLSMSHGTSARMLVWARCRSDDMAACLEAGATAIHLSLPVSDLQMGIIGLTRTRLLDRLSRVLTDAMDRFEFVSVGAQDATRSDPAFLRRYLDTAVSRGVQRVRVADTVGIADALDTHRLVSSLRRRFPEVELEYHAHNDFGMATANALAALRAGADGVSTTVLGIGERAGNASLESVVMAARVILGLELGVDTTQLSRVCALLAGILRTTVPPSSPIVGDQVLRHESGIHTHGQLHHPKAFQPILAAEVGAAQPPFTFGRHSGRHAIRALLEEALALSPSDALTEAVTTLIKTRVTRDKPALSQDEVIALARGCIGRDRERRAAPPQTP